MKIPEVAAVTERLKAAGACPDAVKWVGKQTDLERAWSEISPEWAAWFIRYCLPATARRAYDEATSSRAYAEALATARRAYDEALATASRAMWPHVQTWLQEWPVAKEA